MSKKEGVGLGLVWLFASFFFGFFGRMLFIIVDLTLALCYLCQYLYNVDKVGDD